MPNPEILEFSENHRNPDFHGNSVNSSEKDKISGNPTFYAVSASQGTYEKHRKSLVFLRLASAGTVEVLQREENVVLGADFTKSSGFNGISPFLLQMPFPWSRSSKAYETYGILGVLGRPLG